MKRTAALAAGAALIAGLAWAWWPAGQYQPVRATDRGTLVSLGQMVASPTSSGPPGVPAPDARAGAGDPADARPPPGRVDDPGRRRDQAAPRDVRDLAGQGQAAGRDRPRLDARASYHRRSPAGPSRQTRAAAPRAPRAPRLHRRRPRVRAHRRRARHRRSTPLRSRSSSRPPLALAARRRSRQTPRTAACSTTSPTRSSQCRTARR